MRYNCPNCGAIITGAKCEYCGAIFYDFSIINMDKPTYVKVKSDFGIFIAPVILRNMNISTSINELPEMTMDFLILTDREWPVFND